MLNTAKLGNDSHGTLPTTFNCRLVLDGSELLKLEKLLDLQSCTLFCQLAVWIWVANSSWLGEYAIILLFCVGCMMCVCSLPSPRFDFACDVVISTLDLPQIQYSMYQIDRCNVIMCYLSRMSLFAIRSLVLHHMLWLSEIWRIKTQSTNYYYKRQSFCPFCAGCTGKSLHSSGPPLFHFFFFLLFAMIF